MKTIKLINRDALPWLGGINANSGSADQMTVAQFRSLQSGGLVVIDGTTADYLAGIGACSIVADAPLTDALENSKDEDKESSDDH